MTVREFQKFVKQHGCTIEPARGKGSHVLVRRNTGDWTTLPTARKDIRPGTLSGMLKDLNLKAEYRKEYG
jgi:predicted RNA binding protein YcfA (HicA-like mRNA interferase family)